MKRKEAKVKLKLFSARLPEPLIDALKVQARRERRNVQVLMAEAVELLLAQRRKEGSK